VDGGAGQSLAGKAAVVTGGGRGIGRAVIHRLAAAGAQVLGCGRGDRPEDLPRDIAWTRADVAESADARRVIGDAIARFGSLSILVNNAGVQLEKTVAETTDDDWNLLVGINCKGVFNMCREAVPVMRERGGAIINVGSISGNVADPQMAIYNASKGFVHALTRSVAVDHGPQVRCNAISPGWIMTAMAGDAFALARDPGRAQADALARHPAGRMGTPDDIANAVAWLASDEAAFVTGQCFTIDGGLTAASPLRPGLF
jgi:meso-butanediol dehydrogenase/(S,S)-butanediol dehydrogenase/diacetyl reductase